VEWLFLLVAGVFEVGFALNLKASDGFSRPLPTALFVLFAVLSFVCLNLALRNLPVGTAYAVWTGIGAAGTLLFGMVLLDEPATALRLVFIGLIIAGIVGLQLAGSH
jgi:quaternary ammonium compound-resistance protein SugE